MASFDGAVGWAWTGVRTGALSDELSASGLVSPGAGGCVGGPGASAAGLFDLALVTRPAADVPGEPVAGGSFVLALVARPAVGVPGEPVAGGSFVAVFVARPS
ncbi:hypothetical protein CWE27_11170 [Streptomyces sp. EAG2]|nr:hypothetical protein CWE27_11170 [Streptomyces sp. EAG2]